MVCCARRLERGEYQRPVGRLAHGIRLWKLRRTWYSRIQCHIPELVVLKLYQLFLRHTVLSQWLVVACMLYNRQKATTNQSYDFESLHLLFSTHRWNGQDFYSLYSCNITRVIPKRDNTRNAGSNSGMQKQITTVIRASIDMFKYPLHWKIQPLRKSHTPHSHRKPYHWFLRGRTSLSFICFFFSAGSAVPVVSAKRQ